MDVVPPLQSPAIPLVGYSDEERPALDHLIVIVAAVRASA